MRKIERNAILIQRHNEGASADTLAAEFDLDVSTIRKILRKNRGSTLQNINADRNTAMYHSFLAGETLQTLAERHGITPARVRQIVDAEIRREMLPPRERITTNVRVDVRALRDKIGISQRELAEKLEVTQAAVSAWERNSSPIPTDRLRQIEALAGVPSCIIDEGKATYIVAPSGSDMQSRGLRYCVQTTRGGDIRGLFYSLDDAQVFVAAMNAQAQ